MRNLTVLALAALGTLSCSNKPSGQPDSGPAGPCAGISGTCVAFTAGTSTEADIQSAFNQAAPNTTLAFGPGTFSFQNTLNLANQANITVLGAGISGANVTTLDFSGQSAGADGLDAQGCNGLILFNFMVQNSKGNAFKVEQSQDVIMESIFANWTTAAQTSNGPYGIYPIGVTNLLVENSKSSGASDSGFYIGQSTNVIVRNNEAFGNVAGIEIENTYGADVYDNNSHDNTAGILVFDLPDLPQQGGNHIHVHDNQIAHNNTVNFGASGDIVSQVPAGTGFFVMANHDVEVDHNTVTDSNTVCMGVISYYAAQLPIDDPRYYPFPHDIWLHDNSVSGSGTSPDPSVPMGSLLLSGQSGFPGGHGPDLVWDGFTDPAWARDAGTLYLSDGGLNPNPADICFENNGAGATFVNVNLEDLVICGTRLDAGVDGGPYYNAAYADGGACTTSALTNLAAVQSFDITPFDCGGLTLPPIDAGVSFPDAGL